MLSSKKILQIQALQGDFPQKKVHFPCFRGQAQPHFWKELGKRNEISIENKSCF
jgi:hypothetical protein